MFWRNIWKSIPSYLIRRGQSQPSSIVEKVLPLETIVRKVFIESVPVLRILSSLSLMHLSEIEGIEHECMRNIASKGN